MGHDDGGRGCVGSAAPALRARKGGRGAGGAEGTDQESESRFEVGVQDYRGGGVWRFSRAEAAGAARRGGNTPRAAEGEARRIPGDATCDGAGVSEAAACEGSDGECFTLRGVDEREDTSEAFVRLARDRVTPSD